MFSNFRSMVEYVRLNGNHLLVENHQFFDEICAKSKCSELKKKIDSVVNELNEDEIFVIATWNYYVDLCDIYIANIIIEITLFKYVKHGRVRVQTITNKLSVQKSFEWWSTNKAKRVLCLLCVQVNAEFVFWGRNLVSSMKWKRISQKWSIVKSLQKVSQIQNFFTQISNRLNPSAGILSHCL